MPKIISNRFVPFLSLLHLLWLTISLPSIVHGAALGRSRKTGQNDSQRSFHFLNQSGRRVDLLWVNVFKKPNEFVSQNGGEGYPYGGDTSVSSFIGHEFEIREMPSKKTEQCLFEECRKARFRVNDQDNQEIIIDENFKVTHKDDRQRAYTKANQLFEECKLQIDDPKNMDPMESIDAMSRCMETKVKLALATTEEERNFQSTVRQQMANDLVPYACGDVNFTETKEVSNLTWTYRIPTTGEVEEYNMNILHERPTSDIVKIDHFTTPEFCDAIRIYEENGKIPMTAISESTTQGSMLYRLGNKMYSLARYKLGWDEMDFGHMHQQGMPLFDVLRDENVLELPTLKCVGDVAIASADAAQGKCRLAGAPPLAVDTKRLVVEDGSPQLAQIFLFCDEPKNLGGLHFPQAGIHIAPKVGRLVMAINRFRNDDNDDDSKSVMDGFVSEYHLCPNYHTYVHTIVERKDPPNKES
jgi:hypothetical protein